MTTLLARTAEAIYVRAGYERGHAYTQGQVVAEYLVAHLDECRQQFNVEDEFELARMLALAMVGQPARGRAA
jgi:hypothetical protein